MTTSNRNQKPKSTSESEPTVLLHDEIAKRAYEIYLERNGAPGSADDDWLCAEEELRNREREMTKVDFIPTAPV